MCHQHLADETGGSPGLRDEGLPDSALNILFQVFSDISACSSLQRKSARFCCSLVKNHPFADGDKRIGTHAILAFSAVNDLKMSDTQQELPDIILQVAAGEKAMRIYWIGFLDTRCKQKSMDGSAAGSFHSAAEPSFLVGLFCDGPSARLF